MNVESFDRKVRAYIEPMVNRAEAAYAARYAHWLVNNPEQALEKAESSKMNIPITRRATIRKTILKFNLDGVL